MEKGTLDRTICGGSLAGCGGDDRDYCERVVGNPCGYYIRWKGVEPLPKNTPTGGQVNAIVEALKTMFPHGHEDFIPITMDELKLHSDKNADYTGGEGHDPLGNFDRVSAILGLYPGLPTDPTCVALTYMLKQLDAVLNMKAVGHTGKVEGIDKRLEDVHVYAKIARILERERTK